MADASNAAHRDERPPARVPRALTSLEDRGVSAPTTPTMAAVSRQSRATSDRSVPSSTGLVQTGDFSKRGRVSQGQRSSRRHISPSQHMSGRGRMGPRGHNSPYHRMSPYRPSYSHGQMPSQGHYQPPYMRPSGQFYGGPPNSGFTCPGVAAPSGMMPSPSQTLDPQQLRSQTRYGRLDRTAPKNITSPPLTRSQLRSMHDHLSLSPSGKSATDSMAGSPGAHSSARRPAVAGRLSPLQAEAIVTPTTPTKSEELCAAVGRGLGFKYPLSPSRKIKVEDAEEQEALGTIHGRKQVSTPEMSAAQQTIDEQDNHPGVGTQFIQQSIKNTAEAPISASLSTLAAAAIFAADTAMVIADSPNLAQRPGAQTHQVEGGESIGGPSKQSAPSGSGERGDDAEGNSDEEMSEATDDDEQSERAATPASEAGVALVDKYAFNFNRAGYNHRVPQQFTNGITVHPYRLAAQSMTLKQHRKSCRDRGDTTVDNSIPSLVPHQSELDSTPYTIPCIWVGILPSPESLDEDNADTAAGASSKKSTKKRGPRIRGTVDGLREDGFKKIDFDPKALRVVAKKSDKVTKDVHLYALLSSLPGSKQCVGFKVPCDDVFYFRSFRDDSTQTIMPRKQATLSLLKASAFPAGGPASKFESPSPSVGESASPQATETGSPASAPQLTSARKSAAVQNHAAIWRLATTAQTDAAPNPAHCLVATLKPSPISTLSTPPRISSANTQFTQKASKNAVTETKEQTRAGKRKAEDAGVFVHGVRKKAGVEANVRESVEVDQCDPSGALALEDSTEVEDPLDLEGGSLDTTRVDTVEDTDDENCSEHDFAVNDPELKKMMDALISSPSRTDSSTLKSTKTVSFHVSSTDVHDSSDEDGDEAPDQHSNARQESAFFAKKLRNLANQLEADQDAVVARLAWELVGSLESRRGAPKTSLLDVYFNVPAGKVVEVEDAAEQLKELHALFPTLATDVDDQHRILAWLAIGLQKTGQSVSLDMLRPTFIAFAARYKAKYGESGGGGGGGECSRMATSKLIDMVVLARTDAEAMVRAEAGGRAGASAWPGHHHPYVDEGEEEEDGEEEVAYRGTVWTHPEDRVAV